MKRVKPVKTLAGTGKRSVDWSDDGWKRDLPDALARKLLEP
jgi:hypothetical protein